MFTLESSIWGWSRYPKKLRHPQKLKFVSPRTTNPKIKRVPFWSETFQYFALRSRNYHFWFPNIPTSVDGQWFLCSTHTNSNSILLKSKIFKNTTANKACFAQRIVKGIYSNRIYLNGISFYDDPSGEAGCRGVFKGLLFLICTFTVIDSDLPSSFLLVKSEANLFASKYKWSEKTYRWYLCIQWDLK